MGWSRLAKRIFRPVPIFAILLTIFVFKYYIIDLELFKNTNDYSNGHRVPVGHVERYKIPEHPVKTVQAVPPQPPPPPPDSRGIVPVIDTNHNRKLAANTSTRILKPPVPPPKPVIALTNQSVVKAVPKTVDSDRKRLILAWTSLTDKKPEWGIKSYTFRPCQYKNCEITSNRTSLDSADLLIFRIRQIRLNPSGKSYRPYVHHLDFTDMPARHKSGQIWMDINQESPIYTHADEEVKPLDNTFNISVNYLLDADYSLSYIPSVQKRATPIPGVDYSKGKTKMALWFVSHCNATSGRDQYIKELQKYNISVDIFGRCNGKSDGCPKGNTTCYTEVRQKYKFYLAFENSVCNEYITEKFWNTLNSSSYNIPIALGASLKDYERFSPPNSYLHTRNFTSVKALAQFMLKLDSDNAAFNRYHQWRQTHYLQPLGSKESLQCFMCRAANEKKDGKPKYKKLSQYWSRKRDCDLQPEPIK